MPRTCEETMHRLLDLIPANATAAGTLPELLDSLRSGTLR